VTSDKLQLSASSCQRMAARELPQYATWRSVFKREARGELMLYCDEFEGIVTVSMSPRHRHLDEVAGRHICTATVKMTIKYKLSIQESYGIFCKAGIRGMFTIPAFHPSSATAIRLMCPAICQSSSKMPGLSCPTNQLNFFSFVC
jgi:hypothetical protein